jgi:hypothetical protein
MSKKHKRRIEDMVSEIDPEKDMPLPGRLKSVEPPVEPPDEAERPSKTKPVQPDTKVEYFSTKVERYRR